jgi:hypothetical protein
MDLENLILILVTSTLSSSFMHVLKLCRGEQIAPYEFPSAHSRILKSESHKYLIGDVQRPSKNRSSQGRVARPLRLRANLLLLRSPALPYCLLRYHSRPGLFVFLSCARCFAVSKAVLYTIGFPKGQVLFAPFLA